MVSDMGAGQTINIHAFRRDELMEFTATLLPPKQDIYYLQRMEDIPPSVQARMNKWLCDPNEERS